MSPDQVVAIAERIRPILAGHDPEIQGAVLAECLALWLAGHHVNGDNHATQILRAHLLAELCALVRQLIPINAKIVGTAP